MHLRSLENKSFLLLVALVTVAFAWMVRGFLLAVFWAVVLAVLFTPVFDAIHRRTGGRGSLASLLTLVVVLLIVIVPLTLLGGAVTAEAVDLYERVSSGEVDLRAPVDLAERWMPVLTRRAADYNVDLERVGESVSQAALEASRTVASSLLAAGQQALHGVLMLAVTLYVLFFFLRDGDRLRAAMVRALPLGDPRERLLFHRFATVTRATVKGTFVVAIVQGALGGIAFWLLGLGAPVLWGVLMGLLSLIPAVGSFLVWGPAAAYLFATGAWGKGAILLGVGAGLIGLADNALRPILVGRGAGMPDYLILLSTLGGLAVLGVSGLVAGPVVAGLFLTVWDIFADEFGPADTATVTTDLTPGTAEPLAVGPAAASVSPAPPPPEPVAPTAADPDAG